MAWVIAYALAKKVQRTAITIPLTTDLDFGTYRGINVGAPINPTDIARKVDLLLGLKKVADVEVTADVTSITVEGLDLDSDKFYIIIFQHKNNLTVPVAGKVYFNGDTVDTNYWRQTVVGNGTSVTAERLNNPYFFGWTAAGQNSIYFAMSARAGSYPRLVDMYSPEAITTPVSILRALTYVNAVNVTRIDLVADQAGGIGAGSRLTIYGAAG